MKYKMTLPRKLLRVTVTRQFAFPSLEGKKKNKKNEQEETPKGSEDISQVAKWF